LGGAIKGGQQAIAERFHQGAAMALQLIADQAEILLDPLDSNQLIGEDFHRGIHHIAEHDGFELAFTACHQPGSSGISDCLRP